MIEVRRDAPTDGVSRGAPIDGVRRSEPTDGVRRGAPTNWVQKYIRTPTSGPWYIVGPDSFMLAKIGGRINTVNARISAGALI